MALLHDIKGKVVTNDVAQLFLLTTKFPVGLSFVQLTESTLYINLTSPPTTPPAFGLFSNKNWCAVIHLVVQWK